MLENWKAHNTTKLNNVLVNAEVATRLGSTVDAAAALATSCMSSRLRPDGFAGRPVVSILLNYFKRPKVVSRLVTEMRASCHAAAVPCELVVNVDNPEEAGAWAGEAGFVVPVFSANLHESRGYNRAARLARGKYLVIWQDDQMPPASGQWLVDMMKLFDAYPQLGVLGLNTYRLCKHREPTNIFGEPKWESDPTTGVKWTYAQTVDFAPMAIRASIFESVGGLDEGISRRGDCGIWGDWELSTRMWMDGWQVGFMHLNGRSGDAEPGTTHQGANGEKCWGRQQYVAMHVYGRRYGASKLEDHVCERVWLLNMITFTVQSQRCPYGTETTRWGNCTKPPPEVLSALSAELAELAELAAARARIGADSSASLGGDSGQAAEAGDEAKQGEAESWPPPLSPSLSVVADETGEAAGTGGGDGAGATLGALGIMDIHPVLVRAAGSAAGRRLGRRRMA